MRCSIDRAAFPPAGQCRELLLVPVRSLRIRWEERRYNSEAQCFPAASTSELDRNYLVLADSPSGHDHYVPNIS